MFTAQVPIHVVYLDRSGSAALAMDGGSSSLEVDTYEFTPDGCSASASKYASAVSMLYRLVSALSGGAICRTCMPLIVETISIWEGHRSAGCTPTLMQFSVIHIIGRLRDAVSSVHFSPWIDLSVKY